MSLRIDKPCNEDWSAMTPTGRGAFCMQCSKEVVDFRTKTAIEIRDILKEQMSGEDSLCGRFHNYQIDQFNEEFIEWKSDSEKVRTIWLIAVMVVFGISLFSCQNTLSKEIVNQMQVAGQKMLEEDVANDTVAPTELSVENPSSVEGRDTLKTILAEPDLRLKYEVQGVVPMNIVWECKVDIVLGAVAISGDVSVQEKPVGLLPSSSSQSKPDASAITFNPSPGPGVPPSPLIPETLPLNAVFTGKSDDFEAWIEGLPVNADSKIVLIVHSDMDLVFTLVSHTEQRIVSSSRLTFNEGTHKLKLRGNLIPSGQYAMRITSMTEERELNFDIHNS